jgi:hypothetical protein
MPIIGPPNAFATEVRDDEPTEEVADTTPDLATALSRALLVRTLAFESDSTVALPLLANFLRILAAGGVARRELPRRTGLAKEAVAMAVSSLQRTGLATVDAASKAFVLTAKGQAAGDAGAARLAAASSRDDELRAALVAVLSQSDALGAGLEPPAVGWRTQKPYVTQTQAMLEDPLAALPHHPMVLHRGGWPDGA